MRVLITKAKSWCVYCNAYTEIDGWSSILSDDSVDIWCLICGKVKESAVYRAAYTLGTAANDEVYLDYRKI